MNTRQRGLLLAEWLLAAVLGLLLLSAVVIGLQVQLRLQLAHRDQMQQLMSVHWLLQRLETRVLVAGWDGVHPLLKDQPGWPGADDQLLLAWRSPEEALDCEGRRHAAGSWLVERYFLRADNQAAGLVLACDAGICTETGCSQLGDAGVPIQGGLVRWTLHYGQREQVSTDAALVDEGLGMPIYRLRSALVDSAPVVSVRLNLWWINSDRHWQHTLELPHG